MFLEGQLRAFIEVRASENVSACFACWRYPFISYQHSFTLTPFFQLVVYVTGHYNTHVNSCVYVRVRTHMHFTVLCYCITLELFPLFYGCEERYVRTYCAASLLLFGWTVFPDVLPMLPIEWIVLTLLCMASVAVGSQRDVVALLQALWFATISGRVSFLVSCTCHQIGWISVQHVTHAVAHIRMWTCKQVTRIIHSMYVHVYIRTHVLL